MEYFPPMTTYHFDGKEFMNYLMFKDFTDFVVFQSLRLFGIKK